jgi:adenosylcobinamide-GDP ribazoletransferase
MSERDATVIRTADIMAALGLLTRLPVPVNTEAARRRGAAAAWAYPLAGLVVGLIAGLAGLMALGLGLPAAAVAGLVLAASILVTGALHEDGLADSCDGLWGGWTPGQRLVVMKDSHIGTYGVLGLVLALGLRWVALASLIASGNLFAPVLAAAVLSRAPMVALMHALPNARTKGLSQSVGRPARQTMLVAVGVAIVVGFGLTGLAIIPLALILLLTTLLIAALARLKIGGQTGDILGASQQVSEIAVLLTLASLLPIS